MFVHVCTSYTSVDFNYWETQKHSNKIFSIEALVGIYLKLHKETNQKIF